MNGQELITLKQYIDMRFQELEKQLNIRFDLTDKALNLASAKVSIGQSNKRWAIGIVAAITLSLAALVVNLV
jgi:hypothetical protein